MITLDLRQRAISLDEILNAADQDTVVLIRRDGKRLVLEPEDSFAQEVATLGQSEPFMAFLAERATRKGGRSLDDFARTLETEEPPTTDTDNPIGGA
jgi:hypothetical protein